MNAAGTRLSRATTPTDSGPVASYANRSSATQEPYSTAENPT